MLRQNQTKNLVLEGQHINPLQDKKSDALEWGQVLSMILKKLLQSFDPDSAVAQTWVLAVAWWNSSPVWKLPRIVRLDRILGHLGQFTDL